MAENDSAKPKGLGRVWRKATSEWGPRLLFLALVAALALSLSQGLRDLVRQAWDGILTALGYGLTPAVLWLGFFLVALRWRLRATLRRWRLWLGTFLLLTSVLGFLAFFQADEGLLEDASLGGTLGQQVRSSSALLGGIRVIILALLGAWVLAPVRFPKVVSWLGRGLRRLDVKLGFLKRYPPKALESTVNVVKKPALARKKSEQAQPSLPPPTEKPSASEANAPRPRGDGWQLPPASLLEKGVKISAPEGLDEIGRLIENTLQQYGVEVTVSQTRPGPTVTQFGLVPGWVRKYKEIKEMDEHGRVRLDNRGRPVMTRVEEKTRVKIDSILSREKDLALALAAPSLRIEAPVPGESVVGVEVPNHHAATVTLRSVMESQAFKEISKEKGLAIALGQGSGGEAIAIDLRHMPHLLIAGATGSGKSVCVNAIIASLITQHTPRDVRLLLVDPKRVELTPYNGIPHLLAPVVVDTNLVVRVLQWLVAEMLSRYQKFEKAGVRNIDGFNQSPKAAERLPYIVMAIDELADLMMVSPVDAEQRLCRLAQLGRATGIHLVVATQRPSVDVVTGLIKANFPSRISFAVVSQVDSRTILDAVGAGKLLGRGDMLFLAPDAPKSRRIQGAYVSDSEVEALVNWWKEQKGAPLPTIDLRTTEEEGAVADEDSSDSFVIQGEPVEAENEGGEEESEGTMLEKAKELANRYQYLSTSLLQRRLRVGYPRAARLMDQLEAEGIVGPGEPGKTRQVLKSQENDEDS